MAVDSNAFVEVGVKRVAWCNWGGFSVRRKGLSRVVEVGHSH